MTAPQSPQSRDVLMRLGLLLQLQRRARKAEEKELPFILVNETRALVPYRQAVFWRVQPDGGWEVASVSGQALGEILTLANATSALIASIAAAAEEQSATSDEVTKAVEEISTIANETAGGMRESSSSVQDVSRMALELKTLLDRLQQQP